MPTLYALDDAGRTHEIPSVYCKNEDRELQALLAGNLHLLPGDQIDPQDPRRWLLIGREIGVDDPASGSERWSIDLLVGDQDAIATLVECKRFKDTRSRREVVGQMLDYAANGHHYWTGDVLRARAEATAASESPVLDEAIQSLTRGEHGSAESYFDAMERNLRGGRVRLVFFMEEAPYELKSIVDFLNRQMEQADVLVVEARQYQHEDTRLVLPNLFGYSEEARRAKQRGDEERGGSARRRWDEERFFAAANEDLDPAGASALKALLDGSRSAGLDIRWGTGSRTGSFNVIAPAISTRSILTAQSDGKLWVNNWWIDDVDSMIRTTLLDRLSAALGAPALTDSKATAFHQPARWAVSVESLVRAMAAANTEAGR